MAEWAAYEYKHWPSIQTFDLQVRSAPEDDERRLLANDAADSDA